MRYRPFPLLILLVTVLSCAIPGSLSPTPAGSKTPPVESNVPTMVMLTVYFMDMNRYAVGTEPYEEPVTRSISAPASLPGAVLSQLFLGPNVPEKARGLELVLSGTTGYSRLTIENGIARIYLTGSCNARGATYTIANLIFANLKQFPEIQAIKIYDQDGMTETPDGYGSSIPLCLEP